MRLSVARRWVGLPTAALALLALAPAAVAKTYVPNKRGDHAPNGCTGNDCTLREAVIAANTRPGADKIVLRGGRAYGLSLAGSENLAASGDLDILDSLTVTSSTRRLAAIDGNGIDRVIGSGPGVGLPQVLLKKLRIRGGSASQGGGINVDSGSLRLVRSIVSGNVSSGPGGGIAALDGSILAIRKSTIAGNQAAGDGGGISLISAGATSISGSTISGNIAASDGGGVDSSSGGGLTLTNVTVADNRAGDDGGGLNQEIPGTVRMNAVTVVRNMSDTLASGTGHGGGIRQSVATAIIFMKNSLIALNSRGGSGSDGPDCRMHDPGSIISEGHNLIGSTLDCVVTPASGDIFNPDPTKIKIGQLRNNGGPTKTVALKDGSKAINNGGSDAPKRDQRGVKRKNPDIGAFERR